MTKKIIGSVVALLVLVGGGVWFYENEEHKMEDQLKKDNVANTPDVSANVGVNYKDGNYEVTQKYLTPAGSEDLGVSVVISNNKITAATVKNMAQDDKSINLQNRFTNGFSAQVIGQNLSTLNLNTVSGASLTTGGFNQALVQIRTQAKI